MIIMKYFVILREKKIINYNNIMTTKKTYQVPSLRVGIMKDCNLIATSGGFDKRTVTLGLDLDSEEEGYAD